MKLSTGQRDKVRSMVDSMMSSKKFRPGPYQGRNKKSQAFAIATANVKKEPNRPDIRGKSDRPEFRGDLRDRFKKRRME